MQILKILSLCFLSMLSGCSKEVQVHGYSFSNKSSEEIIVGETHRNTVEAILGTPTSKSHFGPLQYSYISSTVEITSFLNSKLIEQDVLSITFDQSDIVAQINYLKLNDSNKVVFSQDYTEIKGNGVTALQQIMTNVGKYKK